MQGMYPKWNIHIEDNEADEDHEIIIDLEYFSPNQPIWLHSNRVIFTEKSKIANYIVLGCTVTGNIEIDGVNYNVKGTGHHEHSWSTSMLKSLIKGWDWCHIILENGWNIFYSNYYLSSQLLSSMTYKINPFDTIIITTDQGNKITELEDIEITIEESEKVSLLLKRPTKIGINAKPGFSQFLLNQVNMVLDLDIEFNNNLEKKYGRLDPVVMNIGRSTVTGTLSWSDKGYHEVDLNGIGSMWTMRH
jgi:sporulation protein YlmC with PRC-barrel domain